MTLSPPLLGGEGRIEWTTHHLNDSFESGVEQWSIEPG